MVGSDESTGPWRHPLIVFFVGMMKYLYSCNPPMMLQIKFTVSRMMMICERKPQRGSKNEGYFVVGHSHKNWRKNLDEGKDIVGGGGAV